MNATTAERYIAIKTANPGMSQSDMCRALMADGVSFDDAVAASWQAETGKASPDFKHDSRATAAWGRGYDRRNRGY